MTTEKILRALDDLIRQRSILQHAFYRAWQGGELACDQLATYSRVYYPHVAAFPTYLKNVINCTADSSIKCTLEQNLRDELTNPAPHPELWLDFAVATGQDRHAVACAEPIARTADTISTFDRLTMRDIASGLTALYSYESQQRKNCAGCASFTKSKALTLSLTFQFTSRLTSNTVTANGPQFSAASILARRPALLSMRRSKHSRPTGIYSMESVKKRICS